MESEGFNMPVELDAGNLTDVAPEALRSFLFVQAVSASTHLPLLGSESFKV